MESAEQPNEALAWMIAHRRMSLTELSAASGVATGLLSKLRLHAQYPRWDTATAIAHALGVEPEDLWDPLYCQRSSEYGGLIERQHATTQLARPWLRLRSMASRRGTSLAALARQARISPRRLSAALQFGGHRCACALVERLVAIAAIEFRLDDLDPGSLGWRREDGCYVEGW